MAEPEQRVVRVTVETELADLVTDVLWQFGPEAVSETAHGGSTVFVAGYAAPDAARAAHSALAPDHPATLETAPNSDDWVTAWRAGEPSHDVGPFHLRLPEHKAPGDRIDLVIEPGATFGFSHASTLLALELLAESDLSGTTVADVGCGSGVLGIACSRAGAAAVDAVDIDPAAVAATVDNAARNGVDVRVRLGSVPALARPTYGVLAANMLAVTLEVLATDLSARVAHDGTLVLSGLLASDEARIIRAFHGHNVVARLASDDWLALALR